MDTLEELLSAEYDVGSICSETIEEVDSSEMGGLVSRCSDLVAIHG